VEDAQVDAAARSALEPFERQGQGEGPFDVQRDLQGTMQDLVGIVRREDEMARALETIGTFQERARRVKVTGNREYNPGWHAALDLTNLLTCSEAVTRSAIERKESRGGHFRDDYPKKDEACATFNIVVAKGPDGRMTLARVPIPAMPDLLKQVIEENT
jgi:succinate dehydrogenase / fumarate reductase flavoprotein subunit